MLELHAPEEVCEEPDPIRPTNLIMSPIQWSPEPATSSNAFAATPPGCPPGLQHVPREQRTPLMHFVHLSLGNDHPGANSTLSLLKDRYWPGM